MKGIFIKKEKYIFYKKKGEGYFLQNGIIFWPFYPYMRRGNCILLKMVFKLSGAKFWEKKIGERKGLTSIIQ